MRRGQLNTGNNENEWSTKPDTGETRKGDSIDGLAWLNCGKSDQAAGEENKSDEQWLSNGSEASTGVSPEKGGEDGWDPACLQTSHDQDGIGCEENL